METTEQPASTENTLGLEPPLPFKTTRNYTTPGEKDNWWYLARYAKDRKFCSLSYGKTEGYHDDSEEKEQFRTRRRYYYRGNRPFRAAVRMRFENSNEVGAFMKLTNSYCLICTEAVGLNNPSHTIKGDLPDEVPVINTSLGGCRVLGTMCVGNKHGLLLPDIVYDTELNQIRSELPESVEIRQLEEKLSALGNVITCNDKIAVVHPDIDKESEEIIADTLQVEVFRHMIANNPLVGSYCVLGNRGGLVCPGVSNIELENLSSLLEIPLASGTVNGGSKVVAAGLAVNDWMAYAGMKTTGREFAVIESLFQSER